MPYCNVLNELQPAELLIQKLNVSLRGSSGMNHMGNLRLPGHRARDSEQATLNSLTSTFVHGAVKSFHPYPNRTSERACIDKQQ